MKVIKKRPIILAFLIPLFILAVICIGNGIYPFGGNCLLHMDLYHQYCSFFTEFLDKLKNGESLMYSWNVGLGSDFVSVYAYYLASPLNWLIIFFPKSHVIEFIELLIILKISLSGATFFYFLQEHFALVGKDGKFHERTLVPSFAFSTAYALSGFVAAYSWNVMWMDVVALAPLAIIGLEKLVRQNKVALYYVSLELCIISNYYLSIMLCIFLVCYFVWLFFTQKKSRIAALLRFAFYSLLSGLSAMFLIIPELLVLSYSGSSGVSFPEMVEWYFNIMAELGRMCTSASVYEGAGDWPNLYAGVFSILLVFLYVLNKRISRKQKIASLSMLAFFAISFSNNILDFIWHGFHFPDSLPGRQSYLFAFLILTMGYAAIRKWKGIRLWHIAFGTICSIALVTISYWYGDDTVTDVYSIFIGTLFIAAYGIMAMLLKLIKKERRSMLMLILTGFAIVELSVNMAITGLGATSRSSYNANVSDIEAALELADEDASDDGVTFYRVEDTERLTKNDDTRYGYASGTQFSSLMNINVSHFYQSLYMEGGKNFYCYNGATPITSAMLSVRYFISSHELTDSDLRTLVGKCGTHYLYKNNYTLPIGFVMSEDAIDNFSASSVAKINSINSLAKVLGADRDMIYLTTCKQTVAPSATTISFDEDGYYYGSYKTCSSDTLTISKDGVSTKYSKTSHRYLFDFGYMNAGDTITISNNDLEEINFDVYKLNMESVNVAYETLNEETFETESVTSTQVTGHISMENDGRLIFSIPAEDGWSLYVDGKLTEYENFSDTFISVSLDKGDHDIKLVYETPGLKEGALVSAVSVIIFLIAIFVRSRLRNKTFREKTDLRNEKYKI